MLQPKIAADPVPAPVATPPAAVSAPQPSTPAAPASSPYVTPELVESLVAMGFPEAETRAALAAAMGNADLAYEYLLTGIPEHAAAMSAQSRPSTATTSTTAGGTDIEQLRLHPQFNTLRQLIQQNPAALPQVLNLIGTQSPQLLEAIHANNDAFVAMMNEPINSTNPAPAVPTSANPAGMGAGLGNPTEMVQMLAAMPAAQRAQFAQSLGMTPEQMSGFMQMMSNMPPEQLQQMMANVGGAGAGGPGFGGAPSNIIRLSEEEMDAVNRLVALGFDQQQAAQAYLACDKNEALAANFLLEGGFMDDDDGGYGGNPGDDDMYG